MTDQQTERFVAALDATRVEPRPEFVAELGRRICEEAASSADTAIVRTDDLREQVGTNLDDYLPQPSRRAAPSEQKRWSGVAVAVAATILVVVGVVVVADGNSSNVVTDPASSPSVDDPNPSPSVDDPVASTGVDDSVPSNETSEVPEDMPVFRGGKMSSVTVGGPGLVAVGRDGPAVGGEGHAAVWISPDGLIWSRVPHDEAVFGCPDSAETGGSRPRRPRGASREIRMLIRRRETAQRRPNEPPFAGSLGCMVTAIWSVP